MRRGYVELQHGQLHYRRGGRRGAPLLVLLHQTPSDSSMYEPLMAALGDRFDLLAPDTPGFGMSDALNGAFSVPAAASAICAGVRELSDRACLWFGHHTGAALALQVASTRPDQVTRLALSGPCLLDDALRARLQQVSAPVAMANDGAHLKVLWDRMQAKDDAAPLPILQRDALVGAAAGERYPQAYKAVMDVDTAGQLASLTCPTLVFAGTRDSLYGGLDAAYRLLKHGRKAEIPDGRSYACERQAAEVAGLLAEFFGAARV